MTRKSGRKIALAGVILLAAAFLLAACGKKGPPRPPGQLKEAAAAFNLRAGVSADRLILTWEFAVEATAAPDGFYVYRSRTCAADPACPGCPLLFERAAAIPFQGPGGGAPSSRGFEFRETLEKGCRHVYKVAAYYPGGRTGPDSETVAVDH